MIHYYRQVDGKLKEMMDINQSTWINITGPIDLDQLSQIADKYEFPIDFLTDSMDIDERSRYEKEDNSNFILVNVPIENLSEKSNEAIYVTLPIGIILLESKIITVTPRENPIIKKFITNKVKNFDCNNFQLFVLQIFEQNVYEFLADLKKLNLKRNLIEEELYNSSRNKELKDLLRIEKSLVYFVNSLSTNELLKMKIKRTDLLKIRENEVLSDLFEDIIIDNSQALEMSNVYTNILSGTMEAYASIVSNNLNIFIHRLTLITILLMVPTLVASFYGMNLTHLPFVDSVYAFPMILFVSILLGLMLIWFFRRNKQI